jgi:hypothetical protein
MPQEEKTVPQQINEVRKIEPSATTEFDFAGSKGFLKRPNGRLTSFVCKVEWSWTPMNERVESYYLQRSRNHWVLWKKSYDDNYGRWEKPVALAPCSRQAFGNADKDAAMALLVAVFAEERRQYHAELDRFDINDTGLLSLQEIDAVADTVWGKDTSATPGSP